MGTSMLFWRLFLFFAVALHATNGQPTARAQNELPPQKQDSGQQRPLPKLINSPLAPYPEEARKKNIEGKVRLSIVVGANGRVSDATPLSGPPELFQAAIDSARQWQFEAPVHAPITSPVEVSYGFDKECPGPVSDFGEVSGSGRLLNKKGKVVGVPDYDELTLPPYFEEDRKAGIVGKMLLSVSLYAGGTVKEVHVVKSLSLHLDEAAIKTVRSWKFKLVDPIGGDTLDDLQLLISHRATCKPQF